MRALTDQHDLVAHAAARMPVPEKFLSVAGTIDVSGVEGIAASFEERIEQNRAGCKGAKILETQGHQRQLLRQSG
jgi:hypothetical protein